MRAPPKRKGKELLKQRILHKDFHKAVNDSQHPLMEKYREKLKKHKSGRRPQPPDGFLEQSLHFTWNKRNK